MKKILFLVLFGMLSQHSPAMTYSEEEVVCPIGGEKFIFQGAGSGTSFGRMLDFKPYGPIAAPWPIAKCPGNGFVIYPEFTDEQIKQLEPYVLSEDYQKIQTVESTHYLLYKLFEKLNYSKDLQISALLSATWQVQEESYQRYAQELLTLLTPSQRTKIEDPYNALIRIELNRRLGNFAQAQQEIKKIEQHKLDQDEQGTFIREYIKQQKVLINAKNTESAEFKKQAQSSISYVE